MQRLGYLAFLLIFLSIIGRIQPTIIRNFPLIPVSRDNASSTESTLPSSLKKSFFPRDTPSRRAYILFQSVAPTNEDVTSFRRPLPIVLMNLQLEPGNMPGAWHMTTIQLVKAPHAYIDPTSRQTIIKKVFQVWFTQHESLFVTPMSDFPNAREVERGGSRIMKVYLGTTTATDAEILDPSTGAGVLLDVVRGLPQITPSTGQTRSAFIGHVIESLNLRNRGEMVAGSLPAMVLNSILELADINDLRSVYFYDQQMQDIFPDYRIPCLVHYKLRQGAATGIAYSILNATVPGRAGTVWRMQALPDPKHFWAFLQRFLRDPGWDGNMARSEDPDTTDTES